MANLTLSCGLLAVPVTTSTGTDAQTPIKRKMFTATDHEVGSQSYDKTTGEVVERADVVYKAPASDGTLVPLDTDEMASVSGPKNGVAEVVAFAPRASLLTDYVVVKFDQVRPAARKSGRTSTPDPAAARVFGLLTEAMRRKDVVAIIREGHYWAAMTPEGYWLRLAFAHTVRPPKPLPDAPLVEEEVAMAEQLVDALAGSPEPVDELGAALLAFVDAKVAGLPAPTVEEAELAPVTDLLGALQATLAAARAAQGEAA